MTLTDTGPLVALLDKDDSRHADCVAAAGRLPAGPMLTTWPCFTEAMYLLGAVGGYRYQAELWRLQQTGRLLVQDLTAGEVQRAAALMQKYQDRPMDLADASLVAVAETRSLTRVFSLDADFHIYRLAGGAALEVVP
jgi:predicted nucleic acid-binding protein